MKRATIAVLALAGAIGWFGAAPAAAQQPTFTTPQEAAQGADRCRRAKRHRSNAEAIRAGGKKTSWNLATRAKMQIEPEPGNPDWATLIVGDNDWPFPVPLVRKDGKWHFDAAQGRIQILARRIGRNESTAIDGTVYEKDLGAAAATLVRAMTRFNPDKTWHAVEGEYRNTSPAWVEGVAASLDLKSAEQF